MPLPQTKNFKNWTPEDKAIWSKYQAERYQKKKAEKNSPRKFCWSDQPKEVQLQHRREQRAVKRADPVWASKEAAKRRLWAEGWKERHHGMYQSYWSAWYEHNREGYIERRKNRHIMLGRPSNVAKLKLYRRLKLEVVKGYGGGCACCGEDQIAFLAIDHVNNDGGERRKNGEGSSYQLLKFVLKNNFPKDLQILCHNCNMAKNYYGECPHKAAAFNFIQDKLNV